MLQAFQSLAYVPEQTAESWLRIQPYVELHVGARSVILVQPTTTAIVYALGVITMIAGVQALRRRGEHRARLWWGVGLLLWGAGALAAGTSYEAFSYQIKCLGRATCAWTSWWEITYLLLTMASVDAIVVAQAHACAAGHLRATLIRCAAGHGALYTTLVLGGALFGIRLLISFEMLLVAATPCAVVCLWLNARRYRERVNSLDRALLIAWAWLALTIVAYYAYLVSGWTQRLWAQGHWFSENDVLHIGLIVWMIYLARVIPRYVVDLPSAVRSTVTRTQR